jgi:uncharacterized protein GlcG (DUF336 family)
MHATLIKATSIKGLAVRGGGDRQRGLPDRTRPGCRRDLGFVEMAGALPLTVNGEIVGAIGVSSAQPDWDVQIAAAGAAALVGKP